MISQLLMQTCLQLPPVAHLMVWISVMLWEYGLGKTKWGSTFGLLIETPLNALLKKMGVGSGFPKT